MTEQYTLDITVLSFFILVLLLVLAIVHVRRIHAVQDAIEALPPSPEGTEKIINEMKHEQEMTRQHVSNSVGTIAHNTEVNKGLLYDLKTLYNGLVSLLIHVITPKDKK